MGKSNYTAILAFLCLNIAHSLQCVTLVYNMRVRRIFALPAVLEKLGKKARIPISLVPIFFSRRSTVPARLTQEPVFEKRRAGGTLFNIRYVRSKHWWLDATTGLETDHGKFKGADQFKASRVGFDDVVVSGGYRHFFGKSVQVVGYGIAGLPTRTKLDDADFYGPFVGTRIYSLGWGAEISHTFLQSLPRSCSAILQGRFLHGFKRSWFPIAGQPTKLYPGNVSDILCTIQYREKRAIFETGYDCTLFTNQKLLLPARKIFIDAVIRHSVYSTFQYAGFKGPFDKPYVVGAGMNVSFAKRLDARTFTVWFFGTTVF